ncbi:MAG: hypothetical protein J0H15_11040 [Xanthomonadales bacterium]|nr:hypothetical protein [Xanthomonadales bacterium]
MALATQRYTQARAEYDARMSVLRERARALPLAWLLGGGFAGGLATGFLPVRALTRAGGFAAEMMTLAFRAPYAHQLIAAMRKGWDNAGSRIGSRPPDTQ